MLPAPARSLSVSGYLVAAMAFVCGAIVGSLLPFFQSYQEELYDLVGQHLEILLLALPLAVVLGVTLGVTVHRRPSWRRPVLGLASVIMTVPSVALFGLMIPVLGSVGYGVGTPPAVLALILYSLLPMVRNTYVGLDAVPADVVRAAHGMGMTERQVLLEVELPLAAEVILAGVRNAVVMGVGVAAVAAYVGAGGLGRWVFTGIHRTYPEMVLAGAVSISLLALTADFLLARFQAWVRVGG